MERKVRVILVGGLGNQMFMYAAARALALRTGAALTLDISEFRRDLVYKRVFLLDRFPIAGAVASQNAASRIRSLAGKAVRKCPSFASRLGLIDEPMASGLPVLDQRLLAPPGLRSISLRGYWQSEDYFRDAEPTIRRELFPPQPTDRIALDELARIQASPHPVAVGVRFFGEARDGGLERIRTLAAFREQVVAHATRFPGCDYFVFSDQPQHLQNPDCLGMPFTLVTPRPRNEDATIDLALMAHCRSFFIAYSSFHWWGAWLAAAHDKEVTYLHFPGRPCDGYAARGWRIVTVPA